MIRKSIQGIGLFIVLFLIVSCIGDIYYYNRVIQKDPRYKGQISYSDFRVFWFAAYDIYHHILKDTHSPEGRPIFRHFWFLRPHLRNHLGTFARPGDEHAVYKKDVAFYHFRYSPFIAFVMIPLGRITPPGNALIAWYILLNVAFLAALLFFVKQCSSDFLLTRRQYLTILWGSLIMSLRFYLINIALGQTDLIIALLFVFFLMAYTKNKSLLCGLLLALIFQVKPFFLPLLLYFLITGRLRIIAATLIVSVVLLVIPAYMLGMKKTIALFGDWIDVLRMSIPSQMLNTKNQSLSYALSNALISYDSLKTLTVRAQYLFFAIGAAMTSVLYFIMALAKKRMHEFKEKEFQYLEVSVFIVASLLFSVLTWKSYFITLIIPIGTAIYFTMLIREKRIPVSCLCLYFLLTLSGSDLTKYIPWLKNITFVNIAIGTFFLACALLYAFKKNIIVQSPRRL